MDISTESKTLKQRVIDLPVSRKLFIGFAWLTGVLVLVLGFARLRAFVTLFRVDKSLLFGMATLLPK